jgi:hypothetical protein
MASVSEGDNVAARREILYFISAQTNSSDGAECKRKGEIPNPNIQHPEKPQY